MQRLILEIHVYWRKMSLTLKIYSVFTCKVIIYIKKNLIYFNHSSEKKTKGFDYYLYQSVFPDSHMVIDFAASHENQK